MKEGYKQTLIHKERIYRLNFVPRKIRSGMISLEKLNTYVLCACDCGEFTTKYSRDGELTKFVNAGHSNRGRKHLHISWNKGKTKFNSQSLMKISKRMIGNKNSKGYKQTQESIDKTRSYLNIRSGMIGLEREYQKECDCGCGQIIYKMGSGYKKRNFILGHKSEEGIKNIVKSQNLRKGTEKWIEMGKKISRSKKGVPMPKWQYFDMLEKKRKENELQTKLNQDIIELISKDEIIIGLLLSDADLSRPGSINSNSKFHVIQKTLHADFVFETQKHLEKLGFIIHINNSQAKKKFFQTALYTRTGVIWTELRKKWYVDNFKIVPKDVKLTPLIIAWWFMGDGSSTRDKFYKNIVKITFSTQGFSKDDAKFLAEQLQDLGIKATLSNVNGLMDKGNHNTGYRILIGNQSSVRKLMLMIRPFILPVFQYKIKIPIVTNEKTKFAKYMNEVKNNPRYDKQRAIQLYLNYQNTDLTRIQIYDEIEKKAGFPRKKISAWCRYYFLKIKKEKERPKMSDKIIELYLQYKNTNMPSSKIYDIIQEKLDIPKEKRKSLIRNRTSLFNTGRYLIQ